MKMPVISPAVRVSFGLVMFTLSILLIADLMGVIPKKDQILLDSRKKVCESLAVQLSVATTSSDNFIVNATLKSFVKRNEDVVAASMTRISGDVVAEFGEFRNIGHTEWHNDASRKNIVVIPITPIQSIAHTSLIIFFMNGIIMSRKQPQLMYSCGLSC